MSSPDDWLRLSDSTTPSFTAKRILQLMNAQELAEVATNGIDVQLHTHRHRTPEEETLFRQEITENRERIRALTGREATHFCYPSGVYRKEFAGWLERKMLFPQPPAMPDL